ncbi:MAG: tetraacyldisaccharide 4'-kinase [Nitrospinae bacterium]|nr:tetraacyldisaccharide 4'-kinase [Nitrospinota bacterium]
MNTFLDSTLQQVWYDKKPSFFPQALKVVLTPFSYLYGLGAASGRSSAKEEELGCPVISVGNLTVGGTGKTIFVAKINEILSCCDHHGVILTRGYGKQSYGNIFIDEKNAQSLTPDKTGDEPLSLWKECKGTPVLVGSDRIKNFRDYSINKKIDFALLDDGFQHHAIKKDLNVCLIDGSRLLGNGLTLPAGPLREPPMALNHADLIVVTRLNEQSDISVLEKYCVGKTLLKTTFSFSSVESLKKSEKVAVDEIRGKKVVLLSGLGNNLQLREMVEKEKIIVVKHFSFPDHSFYTKRNIEECIAYAQKEKADFILTTGKDAVKLRSMTFEFPVFIAQVTVNFLGNGEKVFSEHLQGCLRNLLKKNEN